MSDDHSAPEATTAPTVERRRYEDDRVVVEVGQLSPADVGRSLASSIAAVHMATAEFLAGAHTGADDERHAPKHGSRRRASEPREAAPVRTLLARLVGAKGGPTT